MFDLETTGIDVNTARIVTAYVGILEDGAMLQYDGEDVAASWLVDPGVPIPDEAAKVHGITTDHARAHGMNAGIAVDEIASALDPTRIEDGSADHFDALVAFNAAYDFTVLDRECERFGITPIVPRPVIDPYVLDKALDPYRPGARTLAAMCEHYGVTLEQAHDAGADARAAGRLAALLLAEPRIVAAVPLEADTATMLDLVHRWSVKWRARQQASLEDFHRSRGRLSGTYAPEWPVIPGAPADL